jgi:hypothetical protein
MRCRYHVGVEMIAIVEETPFASEYSELTRTRFVCSVAKCPCVSHEFDPEKVNKRICRRCGNRITHSSLSDNHCDKCKYREEKQRYATKIAGRPRLVVA